MFSFKQYITALYTMENYEEFIQRQVSHIRSNLTDKSGAEIDQPSSTIRFSGLAILPPVVRAVHIYTAFTYCLLTKQICARMFVFFKSQITFTSALEIFLFSRFTPD